MHRAQSCSESPAPVGRMQAVCAHASLLPRQVHLKPPLLQIGPPLNSASLNVSVSSESGPRVKPLRGSTAILALLLTASPLLAASSGKEVKLPVRDPSAPAADTILLDAMTAEMQRAMTFAGLGSRGHLQGPCDQALLRQLFGRRQPERHHHRAVRRSHELQRYTQPRGGCAGAPGHAGAGQHAWRPPHQRADDDASAARRQSCGH